MSTIKVNNIQNANGTSAIAIDSSGVATFSKTLVPSSSMMYRNLIINGDMRIAQRGTSASGITSGQACHSIDRFNSNINTAGTWTISQDTDVPSGQGFANSFKMQCTTANTSLSAGSVLQFNQLIEGQNLQHLKYGTVNAEKVTVSFWIKSNKTGTYVGRLYTPSPAKASHITFTIDSANTWEKKTLTFNGDTATSLVNSNAEGFRFTIWLAAGTNFTSGTQDGNTWGTYTSANTAAAITVNLADSTSNYINITGVQLEVGDAATPFEHRPYDAELARCQRYYYKHVSGSNPYIATASMYNASTVVGTVHFPVTMRSAPSLDATSGTNYYRITGNNTQTYFNSLVITGVSAATNTCGVGTTGASGVQGQGVVMTGYSASAYVAFDSEL